MILDVHINKHCLLGHDFPNAYSFFYVFYYSENVFSVKSIVMRKLRPQNLPAWLFP